MSELKFKIGDKVRCIVDKPTLWIKVGEIYTVKDTWFNKIQNINYISLEELRHMHSYDVDKFELVEDDFCTNEELLKMADIKGENDGLTHVKDICENIANTLEKKNADYGSSATDTYKKYGVTSYLTRLTDKMNRLDSLLIGDKEALVEDEKIEDTLTDLAGYTILMLNDIKEHGIIKSNKN